jgi:hypothetical protein
MTTTPETPVAGRDRKATVEAATSAPVLITEQEVAFATAAAAVRTSPITTRWWTEATSVVRAALHRMFTTVASDARPARRHYPRRYTFLEHACLAREMDRL